MYILKLCLAVIPEGDPNPMYHKQALASDHYPNATTCMSRATHVQLTTANDFEYFCLTAGLIGPITTHIVFYCGGNDHVYTH